MIGGAPADGFNGEDSSKGSRPSSGRGTSANPVGERTLPTNADFQGPQSECGFVEERSQVGPGQGQSGHFAFARRH